MVNGWKMEGGANSITMKKQGRVFIFDIVVRTTTGLVFCMYLERLNNEFTFSTLTNRAPWSLLEAHERLGHPNKDATRDMVKGLGVTVKPGVMGVCWACTVANAKQKNVVQFSMHQRSVIPGERVFVDISSIKPPKDVPAIPRANWRIVVNECTNFKVSHFFQRKDQMAEATCELL